MQVRVHVRVCARASPEGKFLDLIGTGMSNVPMNQAGTAVRQNSPFPTN